MLYVGNVNETTTLLTDIRKLEQKTENLENNNKLIISKIKKLESAGRIIPAAREKLNMVVPDEAPVYIKDEAEDE